MRNITASFKKQTLLFNNHVMNHLTEKKFQIEKKVIDRPFLKKQICREMAQNIAESGGCRDERNQTKSFEIDYIRHG